MEDQDSILNEFLEKIDRLEKRNEQLRKDIENKKKEIKNLNEGKKPEEENKNKIEGDKSEKIPTEKDDTKISQRFLHEIQNIKMNSFSIEESVQEVIIEYISQEQHNSLYIMGDFTKWELMPMKKNKDIFSYKVILLKGFTYYYSFQSGDQIFIDYSNLYQQNPKNLQVQNYINLSASNEQFDFENDMNILKNAQKNYFLSKLIVDDEELLFLDKFKRHIIISKEICKENYNQYYKLTDSIYNYYQQISNYINPYGTGNKMNSLKLYFNNRIFAHYETLPEFKDKKYKYFFKIIYLTENYCFQCIKLYDNNNIKINMKYYNDLRIYYSIFSDKITTQPIDENSTLYCLLSQEESTKILTDYNNDKTNIIKAYFKTLVGLKNNIANTGTENAQNQIQNNQIGMLRGMRNYIYNYGSIIVTPDRIEPNNIDKNDYQFFYSLNKITKVKNNKEGSYIEYEAIDEAAEKSKKPFRFKIYYSIKENKINIIHCHVLDKELYSIKMIKKEIDKNVDPHVLKKDEEYIKNNELLLLVRDSIPFKLYFKGKKVKMESIKIDENKLYLLKSPNTDSIFNNMYVTVDKIEDKIKYNLVEQCNEFSYSFGEMQNGVDVQVSFDNNKNYVVEPMTLAVSPCLLKILSPYEENLLIKNKKKENESKVKNMTEMEKYFLIVQKMNDLRKYNKENVDKLTKEEKDNALKNLNEYKESMVFVLNYIEMNEMWDTIDEAANIAAEIEDLIKLFISK